MLFNLAAWPGNPRQINVFRNMLEFGKVGVPDFTMFPDNDLQGVQIK